jgi:N-methylhydantoinase A
MATDARTSFAVDIGGTFTDVVMFRGEEVLVEKTLTTPDDLLTGFFRGVEALLKRSGAKPQDVDGVIVHATTIVTNALLERKGARTAMVFTRGFSDILVRRDSRRYDMYDLQIENPPALVPQEDVFTVRERVLATGEISIPLEESDVHALCDELKKRNIQSVGVCLLFGFKNDQHERRIAEIIRERLPGVYISLASEIAPQIREYWRASTTSVNAYAISITQPYLTELSQRLLRDGYPTHPLIMLSSGGVVGPITAGRMPVRMIESGPAAGALGSAYASLALKLPNLLAFDMGGTTAKVCLIQNHRPLVTGRFEIDRMYRFKEGSGHPVSVPSVDMIEIGAGGGSIARIDDLGLLKVGPRSSGSRPGPACYGQGGSDPTVTDADVVLGVIDADNFLGGAMKLYAAAATKALESIAKPLGVSAIAAARGVYQIVCETMAGAVRAHAADRGADHRGIPILAFGGAGPVHACRVAELLASRTVIFPPMASVYSAFGSLVTPPRLDFVRSFLSRLDRLDWARVGALFDEMEAEGYKALLEAGAHREDIRFEYSADMRYRGQQFELIVELGARPNNEEAPAAARSMFEEQYLKRYKLVQTEVPVEVLNWRITASAPASASPKLEGKTLGSSTREQKSGKRRVHLWQENQEVAVMPRAALLPGASVQGPVILEEADTTLVIPPGWTAALGEMGSIVATRRIEEKK